MSTTTSPFSGATKPKPEAKRQLLQLVFRTRLARQTAASAAPGQDTLSRPSSSGGSAKPLQEAMCKERSDGGRIRGFTPHAIEISARTSTRSRLPPATRRARSTTTSLPRKSCFSPWSRGLGTGRGRSRGTCSDSGEAAAAGTARRLLQLGRRTRHARGIAVRARSTREPLRGRTGWCRPDSAPSCTPGRPDAWRASVANDGASDRRAAATGGRTLGPGSARLAAGDATGLLQRPRYERSDVES